MTLVLDLDETLVHASKYPMEHWEFELDIEIDTTRCTLYAVRRPGLHAFLAALYPHFEIAIYTASRQEYADRMIDYMEVHQFVDKRFFRHDCIRAPAGMYVKDLKIVREDLSRVILLDDSATAASMHQANTLPIESFYGDPSDTALETLIPFFLALRRVKDVRNVLSLRLVTPEQMLSSASPSSSPSLCARIPNALVLNDPLSGIRKDLRL
jgi:RNA polymerase II subunit A small phosphatase-like protein